MADQLIVVTQSFFSKPNDKEVSRQASPWTGPESGVFDYFINNGGRPLPAGDWVLEIYVEGKLLSLGAFVIEDLEAEVQ